MQQYGAEGTGYVEVRHRWRARRGRAGEGGGGGERRAVWGAQLVLRRGSRCKSPHCRQRTLLLQTSPLLFNRGLWTPTIRSRLQTTGPSLSLHAHQTARQLKRPRTQRQLPVPCPTSLLHQDLESKSGVYAVRKPTSSTVMFAAGATSFVSTLALDSFAAARPTARTARRTAERKRIPS